MSLPRAIYDWKRFTTAGGFEVDITLTPPVGEAITVKGLGTKHHNSITTEGIPVNAKNVHVSFIESSLTDEGYTVRNSAGEVSLLNHRVNFADITGTVKNYVIKETMPDETVGVIVCILGDYDS